MDILNEIINKSLPLNKITDFDPKDFKRKYINKKKPVLLKGYANGWKAKEKWDLNFFSNIDTKSSVNLEVGNVIQNKTNFIKTDFKGYINKLINSETESKEDKPYLSMFSIFEYFPELEKDIDFSIFTKYTLKNIPNAWIGPSGTVSGFHWDTSDNILAQLVGKKLLIIASPKFQKEMYVNDKYDLGAVSSMVDINNFDEKMFPDFKKVEFYSVVLEPGDAIYIPRGWWHYVKALDVSISVNNFGYLLKDFLTIYPKEQIQLRLHMRGYYKTKHCTCHMWKDGKRIAR